MSFRDLYQTLCVTIWEACLSSDLHQNPNTWQHQSAIELELVPDPARRTGPDEKLAEYKTGTRYYPGLISEIPASLLLDC